MADPEYPLSEPSTIRTEAERVSEQVPTTTWSVSTNYTQPSIVGDPRYHVPQDVTSTTWGPSTPLPAPHPANSEDCTRATMTPEPYSRGDIVAGSEYTANVAPRADYRENLGPGTSYGATIEPQDYATTNIDPQHAQDYTRAAIGHVNYTTPNIVHDSYTETSVSSGTDSRANVTQEHYSSANIGTENYSTTSVCTGPNARSNVTQEIFAGTNVMQGNYSRLNLLPEDFIRATMRAEDYARANITPETYARANILAEDYARANIRSEDYTRPNIEQESYNNGDSIPESRQNYRPHVSHVTSESSTRASVSPKVTYNNTIEPRKDYTPGTATGSDSGGNITPEDYTRASNPQETDYRSTVAESVDGRTSIPPATEYRATVAESVDGRTSIRPATDYRSTVAQSVDGRTSIRPATEYRATVAQSVDGRTSIPPATDYRSTVAQPVDGRTSIPPVTDYRSTVAQSVDGRTSIRPATEYRATVAQSVDGRTSIPPATDYRSTVAQSVDGRTSIPPATDYTSTVAPSVDGRTSIPPATDYTSTVAPPVDGRTSIPPATDYSSTVAQSVDGRTSIPPVTDYRSTLVQTVDDRGSILPDADFISTVAQTTESRSNIPPETDYRETVAQTVDGRVSIRPEYPVNISAEEYARARIGLGLGLDYRPGLGVTASYGAVTLPGGVDYRTPSIQYRTGSGTVQDFRENTTVSDYRTSLLSGTNAGNNVRQAIENAVDTLEKSQQEAALAMVMMVAGHHQLPPDANTEIVATSAYAPNDTEDQKRVDENISTNLNHRKESVAENVLKSCPRENFSTEMEQVICQYRLKHPEATADDIAAHFSKQWCEGINKDTVTGAEKPTTSEASVDAEKESIADKQPTDITAEMRKEVIVYKSEHPEATPEEVAAYFSKQWFMDIKRETVIEIFDRCVNDLEIDAMSSTEDEYDSKDDEEDEELSEEDDTDISIEMKKEIFLYKMNHYQATADEIAEYFSKQWCAEISGESVAEILIGTDNDTSRSDFDANTVTPGEKNQITPLYMWTRSNTKSTAQAKPYQLRSQLNTHKSSNGDNDDTGKFVDVSAEEARHGLMKAIAYFVAHPNIAEGHIQTLWNILKLIDTQREQTYSKPSSVTKATRKEAFSATKGDVSVSDQMDNPPINFGELVKIKQEVCGADNSDGDLMDVDNDDECTNDEDGDDDDDDDNDEDYVPANNRVRFPTKAEMKSEPTLSRISRAPRVSIRNTLRSKRAGKPQAVKANDKNKKSLAGDSTSTPIMDENLSKQLKCPECDECFDVFNNLLDHITRHSEERILLARACSREIQIGANDVDIKPAIRGRGRGHGRPGRVIGEGTSGFGKSGTKGKNNPKKKRKIRPQKCTICSRTFNDYSNFRRHLRLHAGLKPHTCPTCNFSFIERNALKKHMRTHTGEKPFLCTTCGKRVTTLAGLQSHARLHTGEKPFKCTDCGKDFAQSSSLKRHMVVHTGERPYNCTQCGKNFPRSEDLKMHVRTHTGVKPYKCPVCDKCFIKSSYLHKHSRKHTGEKPYKCKTCGEAFSQSDILSKHIRVHTGERPYCCTVCGKTFTQSGSLYNHMKMHKHITGGSSSKMKPLPPSALPPTATTETQPQAQPQPTVDVKPVLTPQSVGTAPETQHVKLPAITSPIANPAVAAAAAAAAAQQMRIFPDAPAHPYLSQWRPY